MGKDWKRRERQAGSPEVPGDYKWSSQSYTLKDILTNFKLPVVVQCREDTNAEHLQVPTTYIYLFQSHISRYTLVIRVEYNTVKNLNV